MRKRILPLLFLTTAFWGCTKIQITSSLLYDDESLISTCTKAEEDPSIFPFKAEDLDKDYFISGTDLEDYIHYKSLSIGHDIIIKDIEPFTYQNAILFYVMNYENGWEIVSADKRTPYLLAKGESGSFTMKDYQSTPWGTWMFSIGMDILNTRLNGTVVSHEENDNLRFWELISNPERVLGSPSIQSIPSLPLPPEPYVVETYTINTIEFIKMNWGWGNLHCDDEFSIGGDWAINLDGYYNFIYSRKMISGFSVNQS